MIMMYVIGYLIMNIDPYVIQDTTIDTIIQ